MEESQRIIDELDKHTKADKEQFGNINFRLNLMDRKITSTEDKVDEILLILKGNKDYGRKGLVEMVDNHEELVKKAKWIGTLVALLSGAFSLLISQVGDFFKNHWH